MADFQNITIGHPNAWFQQMIYQLAPSNEGCFLFTPYHCVTKQLNYRSSIASSRPTHPLVTGSAIDIHLGSSLDWWCIPVILGVSLHLASPRTSFCSIPFSRTANSFPVLWHSLWIIRLLRISHHLIPNTTSIADQLPRTTQLRIYNLMKAHLRDSPGVAKYLPDFWSKYPNIWQSSWKHLDEFWFRIIITWQVIL